MKPAPASSDSGFHLPPGPEQNVILRGIKNRGPVNPLTFFTELAHRYGDAALYRVGRQKVVLINNPEYARDVLIAQSGSLMKERTQQRAKLLLGEGMITSDFAAHRKQRQVAQPAFHRQKVPVHADTIVRRALEAQSHWKDGQEIDVYREMMHLALGIVGETMFSTELRAEIVELNSEIGNVMDVYNAIVLLPAIRFLLKIPYTPLRKFVHAKDRLDETVYRMIREHRRDGDHSNGTDLLSMMITAQAEAGWSDTDLRDQVVTVFLAGYETTAIALTWTWYLLSQNPEIARLMREEIDAVLGGREPVFDDLPKLRYTEMVLAESLRLYPPAWAMGREALQPVEFGPYRIPPKTMIVVSQYVTHRDSRFFDDPLRFAPERHTPEAKAQRRRFSYFPFGMGPRQCIGEALAWMEGVLVLASIAQRWDMSLLPGQSIEPEPLFTLRPKNGVRVQLQKRR